MGLGYESIYAESTFAGWLGNLAGCVNFVFKTCLGVTVMIWVRWTLPRLRIDQVMKTCLKYCTPIAAVCFLGATFFSLAGWTFPNLVASTGAPRWIANPHYAEVLAARRAPIESGAAAESLANDRADRSASLPPPARSQRQRLGATAGLSSSAGSNFLRVLPLINTQSQSDDIVKPVSASGYATSPLPGFAETTPADDRGTDEKR